MIARHWRGLCKHEQAPHYISHLRHETFPALAAIKGFVKASILQRKLEEGVEFLIVTEWESMLAIEQFAGDDSSLAVVPLPVQQMMIRYDEQVQHYTIEFNTEWKA
jgi:heme-degrading monooxygenase HmoA